MNDIEKAKQIWNRPRGKHYTYNTTDYSLDYTTDGVNIFIDSSNQKRDWERNFKALPIKVYIGNISFYVHKGFWEEFQELLKALLPKLAGVTQVSIIGVSLGGATAQLLTCYLKVMTTIEVLEGTTFGSPKPFTILDYKGYKHIKELCMAITQYRINKDIVPLLAPGYFKVGKRVQLNAKRAKPRTILEWLLTPFRDHASYWEVLKDNKK